MREPAPPKDRDRDGSPRYPPSRRPAVISGTGTGAAMRARVRAHIADRSMPT